MYVLNSHIGPISRLRISTKELIWIPAATSSDTIRQMYAMGNELYIVSNKGVRKLLYGQTFYNDVGGVGTSIEQQVIKYGVFNNSIYLATTAARLYLATFSNPTVLLNTSKFNINHLQVLNNRIYFSGSTVNNGAELWESDGSAFGTQMIKDINPGIESSNPRTLYPVGNHTYFTAYRKDLGYELFELEANNNIRPVYDINQGSQSSFPNIIYQQDDKAYFSCLTNSGYELWKLEPNKIDFSINHQESCQSNPVKFKADLINNLDSIVSYQWNFSNGQSSTLKEPAIIFNPNDTIQVQLIAQNKFGITDTIYSTYFSQDVFKANFSINDTMQCLIGNEFTFQADTTNKKIKTIQWDFGDGSYSNNVATTTHTYLKEGQYDVKLILTGIENSCFDTLLKKINVNINELDTIIGEDTVFTNIVYTYAIPLRTGYTYLWSIDPNITKISSSEFNNTVKLYWNIKDTVTTISVSSVDLNGCIETLVDTITIRNLVGLNNQVNNYLNIYPNPTSGLFKVVIPEQTPNAMIKVYDKLGKLVLQQNASNNHSLNLDLSKLPDGYYTCTLVTANSKYEAKVLKIK